MNINEFEENLNNFTGEPNNILIAVLQSSLKNQAILECLVTQQAALLAKMSAQTDSQQVLGELNSRIAQNLARIQADVSLKL